MSLVIYQAREGLGWFHLRQPGCLDRALRGVRPVALRPRLSTGLLFRILINYIIATGWEFLPQISVKIAYRIATSFPIPLVRPGQTSVPNSLFPLL